ncbi:Prephenate dehydratase-domain-containing protein [Syncephalis pseudoplumigaleata]|uniref:Bifunctional chorismate mutase/prephenate dehydratase n=1 Tax=Syncephalis pseudoplumigaleata TaxID=1712513 RepID=A0A4P9YSF2_9FUNG|nr:Prephenate dehydratase-domain-containing protein [Syncephalis pseudoplumigaleata]|eukprot:RKP22836.1 Prephenate dehydratase-domain-containing protein [Syncephalis pseudoplumigaleata]
MDLTQLRQRIASLDDHIVTLPNELASYSLEVGLQKQRELKATNADLQVYVPGQERTVLNRVATLNHGPLSDQALQAIYREIMSASISLQKEVIVAYLGPRGSFSHEATVNRFGDSVTYSPRDTIDGKYPSTNCHVTYGVVPFENSTHGSVIQTLDRFRTSSVRIRAETYLKVRQALLSNYQLSAIKRIYSHPQAFGQTKQWLSQHLPSAECINVSSTSRAAEMAASEANTAAIASTMCAKLYGLTIVQEDIQDQSDNVTRFFVIASESDKATGNDKTLLRFTVDHRQPGALCDALRCFKDNGINLTSINSRPSLQHPWHYYFFVECMGHADDASLAQTLSDMNAYCLQIRVLGSFPNQGQHQL